MTIEDWLFCKFHAICTKHREPKKHTLSPGGGYWYCATCRTEYHTWLEAKIKRICSR